MITHFEDISEDEILNELLSIYNQYSHQESANNEDYEYCQNEICHDLTEIFYNPSFDVIILHPIGKKQCIQAKNTETIVDFRYNVFHSNDSTLLLFYNMKILNEAKVRNFGIKKGSTVCIMYGL